MIYTVPWTAQLPVVALFLAIEYAVPATREQATRPARVRSRIRVLLTAVTPSSPSSTPSPQFASLQAVRHASAAVSEFCAPLSHSSPSSTAPSPHVASTQVVRHALGPMLELSAPSSQASATWSTTPSPHFASRQTSVPGSQTSLLQSDAASHFWPVTHGWHSGPPQSTSVSEPFRIASSHAGFAPSEAPSPPRHRVQNRHLCHPLAVAATLADAARLSARTRSPPRLRQGRHRRCRHPRWKKSYRKQRWWPREPSRTRHGRRETPRALVLGRGADFGAPRDLQTGHGEPSLRQSPFSAPSPSWPAHTSAPTARRSS